MLLIRAPQVRALQVRLRELEGKSGSGGGAGAGEAEEDGGGEGPGGEAEMARLLAHSRKAAVEIQQYGKVGGVASGRCCWLPCSCSARDLPLLCA